MDIKGLRSVLPFNVQNTKNVRERTKTDSATDREGNGQAQSEQQQARRNLSEDELQEAMKYLESLPGVKENGLTVRLAQSEGVPVVYIEDRDGKVVRRIPEAELSMLNKNKQKKSGNLLNKAM